MYIVSEFQQLVRDYYLLLAVSTSPAPAQKHTTEKQQQVSGALLDWYKALQQNLAAEMAKGPHQSKPVT